MVVKSEVLQIDSPKLRQIMNGARSVFMESGYERASVGEIARRAGVSKGTLYNYFSSKEAMFATFVEAECRVQAQQLFTVETPDEDVRQVLTTFGKRYVTLLTSPVALAIFRVVIAEAPHFPELGKVFYESGRQLGMQGLTQYLLDETVQQQLEIKDPELAAQQFLELCKVDLFYQTCFCLKQVIADADIQQVVDAAVEMFLRAYRKL